MQVAELSTVKAQFGKKYGHDYVRLAELNEDGCVNPKVVEKLDCMPPSSFVVTVGIFFSLSSRFGVAVCCRSLAHDIGARRM